MKIHLIAIGGAIMHNLAMELHDNGHIVTGSDDAIYDPALSRLAEKGILPTEFGWHPDRVTNELDLVILGMHARIDNPELLKAQEIGVKLMSFPEFMYDHAKDKKRVVIAGSHGKTTTTSMVLHLLKSAGREVDFLVGAQLEGFGNMVKLSDAPIAVFEGDEYTASPLDLRPKFMHYKPDISVITGIAWDHVNIFDTHEKYMYQFELLIQDTLERGKLIYYEHDQDLAHLANHYQGIKQAYEAFDNKVSGSGSELIFGGHSYPVQFFGQHNFENVKAAYYVVKELGLSDEEFIAGVQTMPGPARRLEVIRSLESHTTYFDFAHAPSKVNATVKAVRERHPEKKLIAILELHTFSSLDKNFIPQYAHTLDPADEAYIFYNPETAKSKRMEIAEPEFLIHAFERDDIKVIQEKDELEQLLLNVPTKDTVLLIMTSGNFGGLDVRKMF